MFYGASANKSHSPINRLTSANQPIGKKPFAGGGMKAVRRVRGPLITAKGDA